PLVGPDDRGFPAAPGRRGGGTGTKVRGSNGALGGGQPTDRPPGDKMPPPSPRPGGGGGAASSNATHGDKARQDGGLSPGRKRFAQLLQLVLHRLARRATRGGPALHAVLPGAELGHGGAALGVDARSHGGGALA